MFVPETIHDIACFIGIQAIPVAMIAINECFDFKRSYFYASWTVCVCIFLLAHLYLLVTMYMCM